MSEQAKCIDCGRERTDADVDYSPVQVVSGQPFGWYSGDDGEICGECFTAIFERANGIKR